MNHLACTSCIFWTLIAEIRPWNGQRGGLCRVAAPVVVLLDGKPATRWPMTRESDFCGQHAVAANESAVTG